MAAAQTGFACNSCVTVGRHRLSPPQTRKGDDVRGDKTIVSQGGGPAPQMVLAMWVNVLKM